MISRLQSGSGNDMFSEEGNTKKKPHHRPSTKADETSLLNGSESGISTMNEEEKVPPALKPKENSGSLKRQSVGGVPAPPPPPPPPPAVAKDPSAFTNGPVVEIPDSGSLKKPGTPSPVSHPQTPPTDIPVAPPTAHSPGTASANVPDYNQVNTNKWNDTPDIPVLTQGRYNPGFGSTPPQYGGYYGSMPPSGHPTPPPSNYAPHYKPELVATDHNRNVQVFSTIPRAPPSEKFKVPAQSKHTSVTPVPGYVDIPDTAHLVRRQSTESVSTQDTFVNPAYGTEQHAPPPPGAKADTASLDSHDDVFIMKEANKRYDPNQGSRFRKKVSFDEAVVYNSGRQTDIVIAGIPEDDSETDESTTIEVKPRQKRSRASGHGRVVGPPPPLDEETTTTPSPASSSESDTPHRMPPTKAAEITDVRHRKTGNDITPIPPVSEPVEESKPGGSNRRCQLCVALVLVVLAVGGFIALGTLYGIQ